MASRLRTKPNVLKTAKNMRATANPATPHRTLSSKEKTIALVCLNHAIRTSNGLIAQGFPQQRRERAGILAPVLRVVAVLAVGLFAAGCSLVFEPGEAAQTEDIVPELRFDFEGDSPFASTGSIELELRATEGAIITDGALEFLPSQTVSPRAVSRTSISEFVTAFKATSEFSLSVWFAPLGTMALDDTPARIVTSEAVFNSPTNFSIGQGGNGPGEGQGAEFDALTVRTGGSGNGGTASAESLGLAIEQDSWVGISLSSFGELSILVNDQSTSTVVDNSIALWNPDFPLALGATPEGRRRWSGRIYHVELYCTLLTDEELRARSEATRP